ncbi:hypothetical protein H1D32_01000 [Anaerobacillus sp. CMMVII]|nr:hypothetical protein [Anaerobacillus sp. CMMVII]MCT8136473.1 hypothetical protein [Anaerobacillus sp. CMMVII]
MKYIEIKLTKCVVFLTVEEINQLLQRDPDLFVKGLRRGKDILRYRKQK